MTAAELREWQQIQKFAAECRRLWPGSKITIRPEPANDKSKQDDQRSTQ
jgi:hypothetical protein